MKLSFHGGAREVTGACHLIESGRTKILIDCGLFQGLSECEDLNFAPFGFSAASIDALVVTHAHIDHIGRIPKLVRDGFRGTIFSTVPTKELAAILLDDALRIAMRQNEALYAASDLKEALGLWRGVSFGEAYRVGELQFELHDAGHILGSAMVAVEGKGKRLLFSGDLGNDPSILLPPPARVFDVEYLIIESTYGNKTHEAAAERALRLERAVEDAASRRGVLMIPAFATERTQDILYLFNEMLLYRRIPDAPVFVDSPLAIRATEIYSRHPESYREEIRRIFEQHPNLFRSKKLRFTETPEESKRINDIQPPKIIIAGSGMMQGGRILHHLKRYLGDPASILLIVGYQAAGSLGRRLIDGEKSVKILGEDVSVSAEIRKINGFSAHADNPQLYAFVADSRDTLKRVFVVQGEEASALHFAQEIRDRLGVRADAPEPHQEFEI